MSSSYDVLAPRVHAMRSQEAKYACRNYFVNPSPLERQQSQPFSAARISLQEAELGSSSSSLSSDSPKASSSMVDERCRLKMSNWCYQVVDFYKLNRETVQISMSYLDRFLCTTRGIVYLMDRMKFQLAAVACLNLAIKVNESRNFSLAHLSFLSKGSFDAEDIREMEHLLLQELNWNVVPPTASSFLQHLNEMIPADSELSSRQFVYELSRYQAELSTCHAFFIDHNQSTIALACLLNSLESLDDSSSFACRSDFIREIELTLDLSAMSVDVMNCKSFLSRIMVNAGAGMTEELQRRCVANGKPRRIVTVTKDCRTQRQQVCHKRSPSSVNECPQQALLCGSTNPQ